MRRYGRWEYQEVTEKDLDKRLVSIGTVHWEGQPLTRVREVTSICQRCQKALEVHGHPRMAGIEDVYIVSPRGVGHAAEEFGDPRTECGILADGSEWWWRL